MQEIVDSVSMVSVMIGGIADDAEQHVTCMDEVVHAVKRIDQMTLSNVAMVEQSALASDAVQRQAERVSELEETFKIAP